MTSPLIKLTHPNSKDTYYVDANEIGAIGYMSHHKSGIIVFTKGGLHPFSEPVEEVTKQWQEKKSGK